jgi:hypothetical protein
MIVQEAQAIATLNSYHLPLNVQIIQKATDWQGRQYLAYWAMKECIREDFLGIADWFDQITRYSAANPEALSGPYKVISPPNPRWELANAMTILTEAPMPNTNPPFLVDINLAVMTGFGDVFVITPDQMMGNQSELGGLIG